MRRAASQKGKPLLVHFDLNLVVHSFSCMCVCSYGFVTFVNESEAKRVLGMDSESFVFKETKLIVSAAYMRPKYNSNLNHKAHQTTNYHQSSQYFYKSKNHALNTHSTTAVTQEQSKKSICYHFFTHNYLLKLSQL